MKKTAWLFVFCALCSLCYAAEKGLLEKAEEDYSLAFSRYNHLKHLEESQDWNEYFSKGDDYRNQIKSHAEAAISNTTPKDKTNVYSRLILWKLYKDQEAPAQDKALEDLSAAALENGNAEILKDVADQLSSYGEKINSRRLYKAYVEKLAASEVSDEELKVSAAAFFKEGNLKLSEELYDVYLGRITAALPKEKLIPALEELAKQFAYKPAGPHGIFYAEKIFAKIAEAAGKEAFTADLLYLRAFNLEKAKEFAGAKEVYLGLINRFPQWPQINTVLYKTGIIYVYVLHDVKEGRNYFEKLIQSQTPEAEAISALYQLGLLSQWEDDLAKAKQYYSQLIEVAKDAYPEKVGLVKERLKEIDAGKPLEYNLRSFLDAVLKTEKVASDLAKADFKLTPYILNRNENLEVTALASAGESGCMPVSLQYLWSGDLGSAKPSPEQSAFKTDYSDRGVKQINLVVVSPTGMVGYSIDLADVSG